MNTKDQALHLLKELTEAAGSPGYEKPVRNIFKKHVKGDYIYDKTGSLYVVRKGTSDTPRVMVCGHLDEVGFVVQSITKDGFLRFVTLGGVWGLTMLSQRVKIQIGEDEFVTGTIAYISPHFLKQDEKTKFIQPTDMYIDIGAKDHDDAVMNYNIEIGQQIVFDSKFKQLTNPDRFMSKAFDNRIGVGMAMMIANEFVEGNHPNSIYAGANAQEEVQARGAITAAHLIKPDLGIVVEGAPADDTPGIDSYSRQACLGAGVQIRILDSSAIMNQKLNHFITVIAREHNIPFQLSVRADGGTDAHAIHLNNIGVPSCVLGVPVRYSHTSNSIIDINDYLNTFKLLIELLKRLDNQTVNGFSQF